MLKVSQNPVVDIAGVWRVEFGEYRSYGETFPTTVPALGDAAVGDPTRVTHAVINIKESGTTFFGTAMSDSLGRAWDLDGYIDGSAILYVYKDTRNPDSFGSAVLKPVGSTDVFAGLFAGVSPEFTTVEGVTSRGASIVSGWVRWTRASNVP